MSRRNDLLQLLAEKSVRIGNFTLASGKSSTLYIDARLTTMSPEGLSLIGPLALETIRDSQWEVDAVGGLTLGADPIACAISYASANTNIPVRAFTVRKEPKDHGTENLIEGPIKSGDQVVIVEDVITTGSSTLKAINAVRAAGGQITGVLALVDREDGGTEAITTAGYNVLALVQLNEILRLRS